MRIEELYNIFLSSDGVSIDTRSIESGQLFFALKGRTFDGNQKAQEAIERGAAYSIVDDASVVESDKYIFWTDIQNFRFTECKHNNNYINCTE